MSVMTPYDVAEDYDDDHTGRRWPWILLGVFLALLIAAGAVGLWVEHQISPPGGGAKVTVEVRSGMSMTDVGKLLASKGVVTNESVFRFYVKLSGAPSVQAGEYTFRKHEAMGDILDALKKGATNTDTPEVLTIPEGYTLKQIADKVGELPDHSAANFLQVANSGVVRSQYEPDGVNNLEGLLLPETYYISKTDDDTAILRRLVQSFDQSASALGISTAAAKYGITPYQVVIIASMVEREAKVPEDRGQIAQVIYNRLAQHMQLQIDATVLYALGNDQDFVSLADRQVDSPYNTYKIPGLPPGPIASPGKASLQAAVTPTPGSWLYYVLIDPSGKHGFATTAAEFNQLLAEAKAKGLAG